MEDQGNRLLANPLPSLHRSKKGPKLPISKTSRTLEEARHTIINVRPAIRHLAHRRPKLFERAGHLSRASSKRRQANLELQGAATGTENLITSDTSNIRSRYRHLQLFVLDSCRKVPCGRIMFVPPFGHLNINRPRTRTSTSSLSPGQD